MHHFFTIIARIFPDFFSAITKSFAFFCAPSGRYSSAVVCRPCHCYSMSLMFIIYLVFFFVFGLSLLLLAPAFDCFITAATTGLLFDYYLLVFGWRFFVFILPFSLSFHPVRYVFIYQSRKRLQSFQFEATNSRLERIAWWHVATSIFIYILLLLWHPTVLWNCGEMQKTEMWSSKLTLHLTNQFPLPSSLQLTHLLTVVVSLAVLCPEEALFFVVPNFMKFDLFGRMWLSILFQ